MLTQQAITILQIKLGMSAADADGVYGPQTQAACKSMALPLSGGAATRETLEAAGVRVDQHGDPDWAAMLQIPCDRVYPGVPGPLTPRGIMVHHTGCTRERATVPMELVRDGRSDLRGPLYNAVVNQDESVTWVTNGRTHHAGMGSASVLEWAAGSGSRWHEWEAPTDDDTVSGNTHFLSIAVDSHPDRPEYLRLCAVAGRIASEWARIASGAQFQLALLPHSAWTRRKTDVSREGWSEVVTAWQEVQQRFSTRPGRVAPASLSSLQQRVHELARSKGWHDGADYSSPERVAASLALIHSEVSECLECVRDGQMATTTRDDGKPEGFPSELADVVIRCLDLAGAMGIDLEAEIERKLEHNATRPHRHGGKAL